MQQAAEDLDFERAAVYRDRLAALSHVQSHQGINPQAVDEADVFAIHQEGGQFCIQVFFFRTGQNWGNRAYFPKADPALEAAEVLGSFLAQFYDDKPCPRTILLSHGVDEQELAGGGALPPAPAARSTIRVPQRGEKKDLVDQRAAECARGAGPQAGRNLDPRRGCSPVLPKPSAWQSRRCASRSTTTRTSWAPMRSARWSSPGRKASSRTSTASSTSARPTSRPATISA